MKKIIVCISFLFGICLFCEAVFADSVDVFIPQREVTMHSSDMAKNFEAAAKKFKQSYSKDDDAKNQNQINRSGGSSTYSYTTTTSPSKKNNNNSLQRKEYTSDWT